MTQLVLLLRHGESADKQSGQQDFDRILTPKGKESIYRFGRWMANEKLFPEFILTSSAIRTQQTTQALLGSLENFRGGVQSNKDLFHGDEEEYFSIVAEIPPVELLVVVGHNPSISSLIGLFTGNYLFGLQPGQGALIQFDDGISRKNGKLLKLAGPFFE